MRQKSVLLAGGVVVLVVAGVAFYTYATGPKLEVVGSTTQVAAVDQPVFKLSHVSKAEAKEAKLVKGGQTLSVEPVLTENSDGTLNFTVPPIRNFKPGKYLLSVSYDRGRGVETITQDFTWGVLAFNVYQQPHKVGDDVSMGMAVLDDAGKTLCDATVTLEVKQPNGEVVRPKVATSDICADKNVTDVPDYAAAIKAEQAGTYEVQLTAQTSGGERSLKDSFQVVANPSTTIKRETSMRIYPKSEYKVALTVTSDQSGKQTIKELVPNVFTISGLGKKGIRSQLDSQVQEISWEVDLEAGKPTTVSYSYDAPDITPEFYLLGPASVGSFKESRTWQIASDEVGSASANRLWTSGAEQNTLTAGLEIDGSSGTTPTVDSSTKRSGDYAYRANTSSNTATIYKTWAASAQSAKYWFRAYVRVDTAPGVEMAFLKVGTTTNNKIGVRMNTDRTIELWNEEDSTQIGSASSALSLSTWYRVEVFIDTTTLSSTDATLKLDGVTVASSTAENLAAGIDRLTWGNLTSTTANMYFDDFAINGDSSKADNWPGEGKVVNMQPNADGDNVAWSDKGANSVDYDEINEVTPDTGSTAFIYSATSGQLDDVELESASSAGITTGDTIKLVQVGAMYRTCGISGNMACAASDTDVSYRTRIKASSGGTTEDSGNIGSNDSSGVVYVNDDDGVGLSKLTLYDKPGSTNYTPWTTADLDTTQIGVNNQDSSVGFRIYTLWLTVEYTPLSGGRLYSSGFELNSTTSDMEWSSMTGSGSIVTSPVNGGTYAFQTNSGGTQTFVSQTFGASDANGPFYARMYIYISSTNTVESSILELRDSSGNRRAYITITSSNTLKLFDEDGQIGSASSALSSSTWYRIEIKFDATPSAGSHIVDGRIDGSSFASASNRSISTGVSKLLVGNNIQANGPSASGQLVIDDVALNKGIGATQNSWPGAGKIFHLSPNAAGDNSAWTNGYANIDDTTPPNDATDLASETTTNDILDVNLGDSALGSETINLVSVGVRFNTSSATEEDFMVRLKDSSNGNVIESKALIPASTTWKTNDTASPYLYPLTAYTRPEQSSAWTDTQLDSAQIGFRDIAGSGTVQVSSAWLLVEYVPVTYITVSGTVYTDEGSTTYNCSSDNLTIGVAVNGGTTATTTCTSAGGTYTVTVASNPSAAGDPIAVWIDSAETPKATTVTRAADTSSNITGLNLYQNRLIVRHEDAGPITVANLATADNGNAGIRYGNGAGGLTVESGISLYIWGSKTFTPGNGVTTNVTGGDIKIASSGVFSAGSNAITIGGSWTNSGTFTMGTSTVTFSSTATGKTLSGTLNGSTGKFYNLVFDGVGGGWTFSTALETSNDFTVTNGAVTSSSVNLTVGRDFTLANTSGVSYTPATSTLSFVRHFNDTGDKFVEGTTSIVTHTGTGTITTADNFKFETLNIGASGFTTTLSNNSMVVEVALSFNGGTVTASGSYLDVRCSVNCTPVVFNSATTLNGTGSIYYRASTGSITVTIAGANHGNWTVISYAAAGNSSAFQLGGNFTTTGNVRLEASDGLTGTTFTTTASNYSLSASSLIIAPCTPTRTGSWTTSFNDSTVTLSNTTTSLYVGTNCGTHTLNLNTSDVTVSGAVTLVDGTGSITISAGTSDFRFAPPNSSTKVFTPNGQSLYNVYIQALGSAGTIQLGGAMDVDNNLTITTGVLDVASGSNYGITIGGSYSNSGTFEARSGTVTFDATTTGKTLSGTLNYNNGDFYNLTFNGVGGGWTVNAAMDIASAMTVTAGTVSGSSNVSVSGGLTGAGTVTWTGGTFTVAGGGGTRNFGTTSGSSNWTFNNLNIQANGGFPTTFNTQTGGSGTITVTGVLKVGVSGDTNATTLDAGNRTWVLSGTAGDSFQLLASPAAVFTANTSTFQYTGNDVTGNSTIQAATYYNLTVNNGSETFVLEAATAASNDLTVTAGTLDVTASNYSLTVGNNYSNSGTFTARSGTVTFTATATGKTLAGTLDSSSSFYNLTFNGSGGGWSNSSAMAVTNDLTMTAGTLSGTNNVTVNGAVAGTAGVITLTGGTFEQRLAGNKNFGTTSGSSAWTFYNLTFSNACSSLCGNRVATTQTGGTGGITVSNVLLVGKSGDTTGATTTLNAGNRTWTLSGTTGDPFQLLASPPASFAGASSRVVYTGNNAGGNTTVQAMTSSFYNLDINNAGETYVLEGATNVDNDLTITAGTLDVTASNYALSIGGNYSNSDTFTSRSGTVTFTATSTGKTLSGTLNSSSSFYNLTFNGSGGGWSNSSAMTVSNDLTMTAGTLSGTNNITVSGGDVTGDGTINLTGGTFALSGSGSLGGNTSWNFYNLSIGTSTGFGDYATDATGSGGITVTHVLTIISNVDGGSNTLNAGSKTWTLSGDVSCPFWECSMALSENAYFDSQTSTFLYTGNYSSGNTGIANATFYNLTVNNGSETYELKSDVWVANNFTITTGTFDATTSNFNLTIGGSYSNSGTFTARSGTVTFNATSSGKTLSGTLNSSSSFYNLVFDGVSGAWTFNAAVAATNDFTVTNGAVTASNNNLTVTRDFTLANTSGVSYTPGSSTVTVSRHWTDAGKKMSYGTSTAVLNGTGNVTGIFYNLSFGYTSQTTTLVTSTIDVYFGVVTFNGGTVTSSGISLNTHCSATCTTTAFASPTSLTGTGNLVSYNTGGSGVTVSIAGGNYGSWALVLQTSSASNGTLALAGDVTTTNQLYLYAGTGLTGTAVTTNNHNLTASGISFGNGGNTGSIATSFGSSTVTLGSGGIILYSSSGTHTLDMGSSSVTTAGDVLFVNGSTTLTVTPGTSTITWNHTSGTKTYTPNGQSLYNIVLNCSSGTVQAAGAVIATNNFTITTGIFDASASNYNLTVGNNYSNSGTFTARSGTVTFNATATGKTLSGTLNGTSSFYNLTFNGVGGGWTLSSATAATNDFTVTNGAVTAGTSNLTVTRDFTIADTAGASYDAGSSTITVGRDWNKGSAGTFTRGTSSVLLNGTGQMTTSGGTSYSLFYNLTLAYNTKTTTIATSRIEVYNSLTVGDASGGALTCSVTCDVYLYASPGLTLGSGATLTGSAATFQFRKSTAGTVTIPGGTNYGTWGVAAYATSTGAVTFNMGGAITTTGGVIMRSDPSNAGSTFSTQNYALTAQSYTVASASINGPTATNFGSSTVTLSNGTSMAFGVNSDAGSHTFDLGTASISVTGNMRFANGTGTITVTPGTATVTHAPPSGSSNIYNPGSQSLYNYTLNGGNSASTVTLAGNAVVTNNFTITTGIFDVTASNYNLTVGGNFANSGTFTSRSGTVTFNGSSQQTVSGTLTGTSAFYNLTITNNSGASATDNERTGFTASLIFSAAATSTGTYTITTANVRVQYLSGATYTYNNINWNGQSKLTRIFFRNSAASGTWLLKVTGTQTAVSSVNVSRSDASVSGGSTIAANDTTDYDAGNNTNWNFGSPITVSGNIYIQGSESTTNSTPVSISISVNNGAPSTLASQTSSYSMSSTYAGAGDVIAVYIDGNALDANSFTVSGGSNITGINLYINRSAIYNSNSGSTTNTNICSQSSYPASGDNLFTCASVVPTYTGDGLLVGGTYAPGGNVNTPKVMFYTGGTYTGGSETLTVTGSGSGTSRPFYVNGGTFTSTSNTVVYTSTSALDVEATTYYNLNLYPASGTQTYTPVSGTLTTNNDFNVGTGSTLTVAANTNNPTVTVGRNFAVGASSTWTNGSGAMSIAGNYTNSGTFTAGTGTVTFTATSSGKTLSGTMTGGSAFYNLTFNGVSGAWTFGAAVAAGNDFTVTNGAVTASNNNLTVTRDFTLANTSGVSYTAGSSTITVSRHWNDLGDKFAEDTSSVVVNGTGSLNLVGNYVFNNISLAYSTFTTTLASGTLFSDALLTLNGGTYAMGSNYTRIRRSSTGTGLSFASPTTITSSGLGFVFSNEVAGITHTIPGGDYGNADVTLQVSRGGGTGNVMQLGGNLTTTGIFTVHSYNSSGTSTGTFNTQNYSVSVASLVIGNSSFTDAVSLNFGSSTVNVSSTNSTDAFYVASTVGGQTHTLNLGSSTVNLYGGLKFVNGGGTVNVTPGTSTVNWLHTSGTKSYTPNGQSLYNLTMNGVGGTLTTAGAVSVTNDFNVTNGAFTTANYAVTVTRDLILADTTGVSFTAGSSTITVGRNFTDTNSSGKFTYGTSTVVMSGTGTLATNSLYNVSIAYPTYTTTLSSTLVTGVYGTLTFNGGTATAASGYTNVTSSVSRTPVVFAAPTSLTGSRVLSYVVSSGGIPIAVGIAGANYGSWQVEAYAITNYATYNFLGSVTTSTYVILSIATGTTGVVLNTNSFDVRASRMLFGDGNVGRAGVGTTNFGSSVVALTDTSTALYPHASNNASGHVLNLQSARFIVTGSVLFTNGTGAMTVNPGTSTMTFAPPSATTTSYYPNGQSLYNMVVDGAGTLQLEGTVDVDNDLTIKAGTLDTKSGSNYGITVGGNWSNSGTFTARSGTVTFDDAAKTSTFTGATSFYSLTSTTPLKALRFTSGTTFTITGVLTLTGSVGNPITVASTTAGSQWDIYHQGTENVTYTTVTDSGCHVSSTAITMGVTNTNGGNNDSCWEFSFTISGTVYDTDGVTPVVTGPTVRVKVSGTGTYSATANGSGVYTISNVAITEGNPVIAYLDTGGGIRGETYTKVPGSSVTINVYRNRSTFQCDVGPGCVLSPGDISYYDTDNDADIYTDYNGGSETLTIPSGSTFSLRGGFYFDNGFLSVMNILGNMEILSGGNFTNTDSTLYIGGNFSNSGTYTTSSELVVFNATTTGKTISGNLTGTTGKMNSVEFNGVGGGWTYSNAAEVDNLTINNGTLTAPSSTLTINYGLTRTSGTFTHNSGKVAFLKGGTCGATVSGTFTGASSFYKVEVGESGVETDCEMYFMNDVTFSAANATDTLVVKGGYVSLGESGSGNTVSTSAGAVVVGGISGETAALSVAGRVQGETNTFDLNANTSTPSCANCVITLGSDGDGGEGLLYLAQNSVLRLNPRSSATASDTGVDVHATGRFYAHGTQPISGVTNTSTDTLSLRETTMCSAGVYTSGQFNGMAVRLTSGLAAGRIYDITGTTVNDTNCTTNSHDSITRASTVSATEVSPTVSGSGSTRTLTLTTQNGIVTANGDQVGRYVHNLVDDTYFRIVSSSQVGAGTDTLTIIADPDSLSGMATNEDIEVTDGVRAGDTFEVIDYASITAEAGTACNATVNQAGEAYIKAREGAELDIMYADICNLGRDDSDHLGFLVSGVDGSQSNTGVTVSKSRFRGNYTNIAFTKASDNNSGTKGIFSSYFGSESAADGSMFSASLSNELNGNFFDGSRFSVVSGANDSTITGNTFYNSNGLNLNTSIGTVVTGNTVACDTSSDTGIMLDTSPASQVSTNTVMGCGVGVGAYNQSSGNAVTSNTLVGNGGGIEESTGSNVYSSNTAYANTYGVYISSPSSGSTYRSNAIHSNVEGIYTVSGTSLQLVGNSIYGNSDIGLTLDGGGCCDNPSRVTSIGDTFGSPSANTYGDVVASSTSSDFPERVEVFGSTFNSSTPFNGFSGTDYNSILIFHRNGSSTTNQIYGNYTTRADDATTAGVNESVLNLSDLLPSWSDRTFPAAIEAGSASGAMGSITTGLASTMGGTGTSYTYQVVCSEDNCSSTQSSWKVYRNGTLLTNRATTMVQYTDTQVDGGTAPNVTFTIPKSTSGNYGEGYNFSFIALKAATDSGSNKTLEVMTDGVTVTVAGGTTLNLHGIQETPGSILKPNTATTTYNLVVDGALTGNYGETQVSGSFTGSGTVEMDENSLVTMLAGSSSAKTLGSTSGSNQWKLGQLSFSNASAGSVTYTLASGGTGKIIPVTTTVGQVSDAQTTTVTNATNNRSIEVTSVNVVSNGILTASATAPFLVSGAWSITGTGVFNANGGTVTFTGPGASSLTGTTTFANLTISSPVAKTMNFPTGAGEIIHVTGAFTAQSLLGQRHLLQSTSGGSKWHFHPTGTYSIDNIRVQDGGCESGALTMTVYNSQDLGNNDSCWVFNDTTGESNRANSGTIRGGSGTIRVK